MDQATREFKIRLIVSILRLPGRLAWRGCEALPRRMLPPHISARDGWLIDCWLELSCETSALGGAAPGFCDRGNACRPPAVASDARCAAACRSASGDSVHQAASESQRMRGPPPKHGWVALADRVRGAKNECVVSELDL